MSRSSHVAQPKQDTVLNQTRKQDAAKNKTLHLQQTLRELEAQRTALSIKMLGLPSQRGNEQINFEDVTTRALALAKQTSQKHIKLLTEYNDIKDAASGLIGMIAENRGTRIVETMHDFGVDKED